MAARKHRVPCSNCGAETELFRNPVPTVDIIIELKNDGIPQGIILIQRKNEPTGWAIPGGFVDYGETVESAAVREAREETGLEVKLKSLFGVYSAPERDPRQHTISTVFIAEAIGNPEAGDDARGLALFDQSSLPENIVFDHKKILREYYRKQSDQGRAVQID